MKQWFSLVIFIALTASVSYVFASIGDPCGGANCEFPSNPVPVSCPGASGPDALNVSANGIRVGTCSDGDDNDCDGLVDSADPQCGLVDPCLNVSHDEKACAGSEGDLGDDIQEGSNDNYYCDTDYNASPDTYYCCKVGNFWDQNAIGGPQCSESTPPACDDSCNLDNFTDNWWNATSQCIFHEDKGCVQEVKHGQMIHTGKPVSSY